VTLIPASVFDNKIVRALWNDEFLRVLDNFPAARHDDEVDSLSGAYENLASRGGPFEFEDVRVRDSMLRGIDCLGGRYERGRRGLGY
jgi:hypothetical protein